MHLRTIIKSTIIVAIACAVLLGPNESGRSADNVPKGFEIFDNALMAPTTVFFDGDGHPTKIERFREKVVILNLWATWCAPCVREMPSLERLSARLPVEQFAVVAVSQDKGGKSISKPFLERLGIQSLALYTDPNGRLYRDFGARGMPTTVIVGPEGKLIARLEGAAEWDEQAILDFLLGLRR